MTLSRTKLCRTCSQVISFKSGENWRHWIPINEDGSEHTCEGKRK